MANGSVTVLLLYVEYPHCYLPTHMYLNKPFVNTVKLVLDKLYGLLSGLNCPPLFPFDTAIANKAENANGNVKVNVCPSTSEEPHCSPR